MATYFVQNSLHVASGMPADQIVNTFLVVGPGLGTQADDADAIRDAMRAFYDDLASAGILSEWATGDFDCAIYAITDLTDDNIGSPFFFDEATFGPPAGAPLPTEVAMCLSFRAAPASGVPAKSRRGRVFIGPLGVSILDTADGPRPSSSSVGDLADAGEALTTSLGSSSLGLAIWSRKLGISSGVAQLWVDDEFDTVRSRGRESTSRSVRP